jgi:hypothetical protein
MIEPGMMRRTRMRPAWLASVAFAGLLLGCFPHHEEPDAAAPDAQGGPAGAPGQDGAARDDGGSASAGADASTTGGGGSPGARCTNACSTGATRCTSRATLETCAMGANGCTSFVASTCPSGSVCERTAPAACVDPEWAEWPMPNSANDVATGAPNLAALVDNQDGTVSDKVTGLMWEQDFHPSVYPTGEAFCESVTTGGYTDWRLPTIIELISIADFSRDQPSLDTTVFPLASGVGPFWSDTVRAGFGSSRDIMDYFFPFVENAGGFGVDGIPGQDIRCVR